METRKDLAQERVRFGPGNFFKLAQSNYGNNQRQGTFGEQFSEVYNLAINGKLGSLYGKIILGNTATVLSKSQELIFIDFPDIKEGKISIDENLEDRLNGNPIKDVRFSKDKQIRAIPLDCVVGGSQNHESIAQNQLLIAMTGYEISPEMMAKLLERINASCYILAPNSFSNSRVGIPFFGYNPEQNEWTIMAASIPKIKGDNRYSFAIPINS